MNFLVKPLRNDGFIICLNSFLDGFNTSGDDVPAHIRPHDSDGFRNSIEIFLGVYYMLPLRNDAKVNIIDQCRRISKIIGSTKTRYSSCINGEEFYRIFVVKTVELILLTIRVAIAFTIEINVLPIFVKQSGIETGLIFILIDVKVFFGLRSVGFFIKELLESKAHIVFQYVIVFTTS